MRAYADTLIDALANNSPDIETELIELDPEPSSSRWGRRLQTALLPARAWQQRARAPDVWHVLDGSRAYIARALNSAPVVLTVHDIIPWLQANGRFPGAPAVGVAARYLWQGNGQVLRQAAELVCDSACTARDLQQMFGIAAETCRVVPLAVRPTMATLARQRLDAPRSDGIVLHVGNNGFYKNRALVLRIFARVDATLAQRLVMAGPEPTLALRRLADELQVSDRVEWLLDPDDYVLADYYRRAAVLLFPSLYEGFGWPVLEAMAFGLPVVASDAGSLAEVVGNSAECIPPEDEDRFVRTVAELLRSPQAAEAAAMRGIVRAREFSSEVFAKRMRETYLRAIESRQGCRTA